MINDVLFDNDFAAKLQISARKNNAYRQFDTIIKQKETIFIRDFFVFIWVN